MNYEEILEVSRKISVTAGKAIMEIYNKEEIWQVQYKENHSPLTLADKKAHEKSSPKSCWRGFQSARFSPKKGKTTANVWTTPTALWWTHWTAPKNLSKRTASSL